MRERERKRERERERPINLDNEMYLERPREITRMTIFHRSGAKNLRKIYELSHEEY